VQLKRKPLDGAPSRHRTHRYLLRDLTHATLARQPAVWFRCTITLQEAAYECHLLNKGCRTLRAADRWGALPPPERMHRRVRRTSGADTHWLPLPHPPTTFTPSTCNLQRATFNVQPSTCNLQRLLPRASCLAPHSTQQSGIMMVQVAGARYGRIHA